MRWDAANLKKYGVSFHRTNDAEIIEFIEKHKAIGTTELFRRAIEKLMNGDLK